MKYSCVTVVLPFRDHEQKVGRACRNIAAYFREQKQPFQIVAVDEGSGDNSHAVLALLSREIPELKVVVGKGYGAGSREALGRTVVLTTPESAAQGLSPSLTPALLEVESGHVHMQQVADNLLVCEVLATRGLVAKSGGWRPSSEQKLLRKGRAQGLTVRTYGPESGKRDLAARLAHAFRFGHRRSPSGAW